MKLPCSKNSIGYNPILVLDVLFGDNRWPVGALSSLFIISFRLPLCICTFKEPSTVLSFLTTSQMALCSLPLSPLLSTSPLDPPIQVPLSSIRNYLFYFHLFAHTLTLHYTYQPFVSLWIVVLLSLMWQLLSTKIDYIPYCFSESELPHSVFFWVPSINMKILWFHLLNGWKIFHCMKVPYFLFSLIFWMAFRLFSDLATMNRTATKIFEQMFL